MTDRTYADWQARAGNVSLPHLAYLDGHFVPAVSSATFAAENPATGQVLTEVAACDTADVDRAVTSARRSFESGEWRDLPPTERKQRMLAWANAIEA